jgi:hypothetical protein
MHDPVAAVIFCTPITVDYSVINGRVIVREGQIASLDFGMMIERQNHHALQLAQA